MNKQSEQGIAKNISALPPITEPEIPNWMSQLGRIVGLTAGLLTLVATIRNSVDTFSTAVPGFKSGRGGTGKRRGRRFFNKNLQKGEGD
jgi:hypothetical protein